MKIKNRRDGSFVCRLPNGRKVEGLYGRDPLTGLPRALSLSIITKDHFGNPKAVVTNYDIDPPCYLADAELREYAETLDRRAERLERGLPSAPSVIKLDLPAQNQTP
jgi:hypothetical protein